jgi:quercetin dioxygenase-like cupin family protein
MRRIAQLGTLAGLAVVALVMNAGTTLATPSTGFGAPFTYRATVQPLHIDSNDFKIDQKNPEDVVVRELTIAPGGSSGWHSHPGPVIVLIVQGTVVNYDASDPTCTGTTIVAGQSYLETPGDVHEVRNEDPTTTAVLIATFLDVPVGGMFRLDAAQPTNCRF